VNPTVHYDQKTTTEHRLSLLQKILLSTDGTVTDLIALYAGGPIRVKKIEQTVEVKTAPTLLACDGPLKLLSRKILLSGASRNYLYAESVFVFERFSASIQDQLLNTDQPIGLLWKEARLETYREIVDQQVAPSPDTAHYFDIPVNAPFVARTYVIFTSGKPLGAITEKWPLSFFREPLANSFQ
jgi:chorismate-pyruvate lyase